MAIAPANPAPSVRSTILPRRRNRLSRNGTIGSRPRIAPPIEGDVGAERSIRLPGDGDAGVEPPVEGDTGRSIPPPGGDPERSDLPSGEALDPGTDPVSDRLWLTFRSLGRRVDDEVDGRELGHRHDGVLEGRVPFVFRLFRHPDRVSRTEADDL